MNQSNIFFVGLILSIILMANLFVAHADDKAKSIIRDVLKKYEESKNIKVDFLQTFNWKLTGNISEQKGTIWLQGKEKFKIITEDQTILSDGETIWTYSKINKQVIIDKVANAEDINLPRDILLNFSDQYESIYVKNEKVNNKDCFFIELSSKEDDLFIKQIKLWIETKKMILLKIEQVDLNENANTYFLTNFKANTPISAKFFKFEVPDTLEVIDMR
ncbi:outer membrane lipoprotein carrier protein LolA [candidate division KSB1 bacterium]|nr:outer membrane lipoprotein carrier protein LolA [candidate division KSB1 bacterium]MBL7093434.1 outer membrane lipoprotein carrier protein LolA [candidate division KSB1 bacterium]